jgi:arylsulfatase A-like enzyme
VTSTDFFPTFIDATGLQMEPEYHLDGVSIMPILKGGVSLDREALFWHYPHYGNNGGTPGSSVRAGNYILIEFFEDDMVELYDLSSDPSERYDLSERLPAATKTVATYASSMARLRGGRNAGKEPGIRAMEAFSCGGETPGRYPRPHQTG